MGNKIDLNKLYTEIDSRKKDRGIISSRLGESGGNSQAPRDSFLNELVTTLNTGKETSASSLIKAVENKVAIKNGESRQQINEFVVTKQPQASSREIMDVSPERDEMLFRDLESKRKQTLSESMQSYLTPNTGAGGNKPQSVGNQPQQLNEAFLVENVKNIVDNHLIDNFGLVIEEAIKSTIIEMYAVDRIKSVLNENKEMVRGLVVDIIREIQQKNKNNNKTQS